MAKRVDAFVERAGLRWAVKQGNTGKTLSLHADPARANERVAQLHKENNPAKASRGAQAKGGFGKESKAAKRAGDKEAITQVMARKESSAARTRRSADDHQS